MEVVVAIILLGIIIVAISSIGGTGTNSEKSSEPIPTDMQGRPYKGIELERNPVTIEDVTQLTDDQLIKALKDVLTWIAKMKHINLYRRSPSSFAAVDHHLALEKAIQAEISRRSAMRS